MDNINQHHSNTTGGVVHQCRSDGAMRKIFNDVDDHNTGVLNSDRRNSDQGSVTSELSRDNDTHSLRGSEYKKRNSIFNVFNSNSDSTDTVGQGKKTVHIPRKSIFGSSSSNNDVYNNINSSSSSINHGTNDGGHYYNGGMIVGRNMLSGDMLEVRPDGNLNKIEIDSLKEESKVDPTVLLGWQIELEDEDKSTASSAVKHYTNVIYVITDVRKNFLSQTEYRLSRYKEEDRWVKLCRSKERSIIDENKGKHFFNPLRKVLFNLQAVDEESIA